MKTASVVIAVLMERAPVQSRWVNAAWRVHSVLASDEPESAPARLMRKQGESELWLHPGFSLTLHHDEAEGYYLNLHSPEPRVFVMWREHEGETRPRPVITTVSYNEAARMLDGGEQVDSVPLPAELVPWLAEYVQANYTPETKKQRVRPKSFESKEGRYQSSLDKGSGR